MSKTLSKGITIVELIVVIIVLVALSVVAIPQVSISASNAKQNACDTNIDMINSAIEMYNADNGAYPKSLTDVIGTRADRTSYFPDGPPVCPFGGSYSITADNRVICSH